MHSIFSFLFFETRNVEAILFNWYDREERPLNFKLMSNLIMLIVHDSPIFHFKSTPSIDLPDSLRYLYWWGYPLESLPLKFSPENLVDLHMPCSQVKKLWKEGQRPVNLQVLNLPGSIYLTEVPNLSGSLKIVNIDLSSCRRLVEIPWYFQDLDSLTHLCLRGCTSLKYLPEMPTNIKYLNLSESGIKEYLPKSICKLKYLEELDLSSCSELENFQEILERMEHLKSLNLSGTMIQELHSSIEFLPALNRLELHNCKRLPSIPKSICKLKYLEELNLSWCSELENFPKILEPMEHLKFLDLSGTSAHNCNHGQCSCLHYQLEMSYAITSCSLSR
ncbi:unnamed protein product [Malus baccata var. baccata]